MTDLQKANQRAERWKGMCGICAIWLVGMFAISLTQAIAEDRQRARRINAYVRNVELIREERGYVAPPLGKPTNVYIDTSRLVSGDGKSWSTAYASLSDLEQAE